MPVKPITKIIPFMDPSRTQQAGGFNNGRYGQRQLGHSLSGLSAPAPWFVFF